VCFSGTSKKELEDQFCKLLELTNKELGLEKVLSLIDSLKAASSAGRQASSPETAPTAGTSDESESRSVHGVSEGSAGCLSAPPSSPESSKVFACAGGEFARSEEDPDSVCDIPGCKCPKSKKKKRKKKERRQRSKSPPAEKAPIESTCMCPEAELVTSPMKELVVQLERLTDEDIASLVGQAKSCKESADADARQQETENPPTISDDKPGVHATPVSPQGERSSALNAQTYPPHHHPVERRKSRDTRSPPQDKSGDKKESREGEAGPKFSDAPLPFPPCGLAQKPPRKKKKDDSGEHKDRKRPGPKSKTRESKLESKEASEISGESRKEDPKGEKAGSDGRKSQEDSKCKSSPSSDFLSKVSKEESKSGSRKEKKNKNKNKVEEQIKKARTEDKSEAKKRTDDKKSSSDSRRDHKKEEDSSLKSSNGRKSHSRKDSQDKESSSQRSKEETGVFAKPLPSNSKFKRKKSTDREESVKAAGPENIHSPFSGVYDSPPDSKKRRAQQDDGQKSTAPVETLPARKGLKSVAEAAEAAEPGKGQSLAQSAQDIQKRKLNRNIVDNRKPAGPNLLPTSDFAANDRRKAFGDQVSRKGTPIHEQRDAVSQHSDGDSCRVVSTHLQTLQADNETPENQMTVASDTSRNIAIERSVSRLPEPKLNPDVCRKRLYMEETDSGGRARKTLGPEEGRVTLTKRQELPYQARNSNLSAATPQSQSGRETPAASSRPATRGLEVPSADPTASSEAGRPAVATSPSDCFKKPSVPVSRRRSQNRTPSTFRSSAPSGDISAGLLLNLGIVADEELDYEEDTTAEDDAISLFFK